MCRALQWDRQWDIQWDLRWAPVGHLMAPPEASDGTSSSGASKGLQWDLQWAPVEHLMGSAVGSNGISNWTPGGSPVRRPVRLPVGHPTGSSGTPDGIYGGLQRGIHLDSSGTPEAPVAPPGGSNWTSVGHPMSSNGTPLGSGGTSDGASKGSNGISDGLRWDIRWVPVGPPVGHPVGSPMGRAVDPHSSRPSPQLRAALGLHDPQLLEGLLPGRPPAPRLPMGWSCRGREERCAHPPLIYRISLFLFNVQNCTEGGGGARGVGSGCWGPTAR